MHELLWVKNIGKYNRNRNYKINLVSLTVITDLNDVDSRARMLIK